MEEVLPSDIVVVRPGEKVPVDGVVTDCIGGDSDMARARLITGGKVLRGLTVNGYQWNPSAGLGRANDESPHRFQKVKGSTKKRRPKSGGPPREAHACRKRFNTSSGRDDHFKACLLSAAPVLAPPRVYGQCGEKVVPVLSRFGT